MLSNMEIHSSASGVLVCLSTYPLAQKPHHYRGFTITITHTHTPLGRTPLDELTVRRIPLYLTALNTHNPPPGFEPAITGSESLKAHALDRATTGCGVPQ